MGGNVTSVVGHSLATSVNDNHIWGDADREVVVVVVGADDILAVAADTGADGCHSAAAVGHSGTTAVDRRQRPVADSGAAVDSVDHYTRIDRRSDAGAAAAGGKEVAGWIRTRAASAGRAPLRAARPR